jgi:hypothetical protein
MEIWMLQVSCDLYPKVFVGDGQVYKPSTTSTKSSRVDSRSLRR